MRVLLVVPTYNYKWRYPLPMSMNSFSVGIAYLASSLNAAGHQAFGVNLNNMYQYNTAQEMVRTELTKACKTYEPELIGIGGLCTDYSFIKDSMAIAREVMPHTPIVLGGRIVTHDEEFIVNQLKPEYSISGDGEHKIVQLANMLSGKPTPIFSDNIDSLPFPDYTYFDIEKMFDNSGYYQGSYFFTREHPRVMSLITGRGCVFSCSFCLHKQDRRYRTRSIKSIREEIAQTYDKYHYNILLLLDELFAINKDRVVEFSQMMLEGKEKLGWDIDWTFQTHASSKLDIETLKLAKRAGCFSFSYGVESLSPTVLASMNKKIQPELVYESLKKSEEVGLGFIGSIICGDEAESPKTLNETLSAFKKHCTTSLFSFGTVHPYPGSKLFDDCMEKGIIKNRLDFYEHMDEQLYNMTTMPYWIWRPYSIMLGILGSKHLWHKSAGFDENGNVLCPHCGHKVVVVHTQDVPLKQIKEHSKYYQFALMLSAIPILFNPLILTLRNIAGKPGNYYISGCKNCGKSFKVKYKDLNFNNLNALPEHPFKEHPFKGQMNFN
jgi:anaerobic magnesium-protoporphyrin IX monomethyl ester cyclase